MQEDNYKEERKEEIKLGLELSDTADYNVDMSEREPEETAPEAGAGRRRRRRSSESSGMVTAFLAGFLCCLVAAGTCMYVFGLGRFVPQDLYEYYKELNESCGKYYRIMKLIDEDPIAETVPEEISDEELKEIVKSTGDPYAQYFTAEEYEAFSKKYEGEYVGIGVAVTENDAGVVIKKVMPDSPAEDAGFREDDVIIRVDGKKPADVDDAVDLISGEAGTAVEVTVARNGEEITKVLNRAKIEQDSVAYSPLKDDPDIGCIIIGSFIKDTDKEFELAVRDLKAEGCDKFIIDLRDNGGGLTESSINIADYLLPACRIMSEVTKNGKETVHNSDASSADLDCVLLVNGNTASSSEILAAALQDNDACTVIGTKTYGKGVTQIMKTFDDGSAVKITRTEYFRPSGKTVNEIGITPDIEAEGEEAFDKAIEVLKK